MEMWDSQGETPKGCCYEDDMDSDHEGGTAATFKIVSSDTPRKPDDYACPKCVLNVMQEVVCVVCQDLLGHHIFPMDNIGGTIKALCPDCLLQARGHAEDQYEEEQAFLDEERRAKRVKEMESVWT